MGFIFIDEEVVVLEELPVSIPGTIKSIRVKVSSRKDFLKAASAIPAIKVVRFLPDDEVEVYLTRELSLDEFVGC